MPYHILSIPSKFLNSSSAHTFLFLVFVSLRPLQLYNFCPVLTGPWADFSSLRPFTSRLDMLCNIIHSLLSLLSGFQIADKVEPNLGCFWENRLSYRFGNWCAGQMWPKTHQPIYGRPVTGLRQPDSLWVSTISKDQMLPTRNLQTWDTFGPNIHFYLSLVQQFRKRTSWHQ